MNPKCDKSNVRWTAMAALSIALALVVSAQCLADDRPRNQAPQGARQAALRGDFTRHTVGRRTGHGHESTTTCTTRTEDGYTRNTTWTNSRGEQGTRDVTATYDRATGTWSKDVSVDRPGQ